MASATIEFKLAQTAIEKDAIHHQAYRHWTSKHKNLSTDKWESIMTQELINKAMLEDKEIRKTYTENQWWFSVVDIVSVLTESENPRVYWNWMKSKNNDSEGSLNCLVLLDSSNYPLKRVKIEKPIAQSSKEPFVSYSPSLQKRPNRLNDG